MAKITSTSMSATILPRGLRLDAMIRFNQINQPQPVLATLLYFLLHYSLLLHANVVSLQRGFHHPTGCFP
jgi:hypothetical protein